MTTEELQKAIKESLDKILDAFISKKLNSYHIPLYNIMLRGYVDLDSTNHPRLVNTLKELKDIETFK